MTAITTVSFEDVTELELKGTSLVGSICDSPDYQDCYSVDVPASQYDSVDAVVTDWFTKQPAWLRIVSTNTFSASKIQQATADSSYPVGHKIGSWEILARNDDEIVFGDKMGFMRYWFSFRLVDGDQTRVEASTSVEYLWRRTGGFYFRLVRPFHRRFLKRLLFLTVA